MSARRALQLRIEAADVAFEQAAYFRLRGITASEACDALSIARNASWAYVEGVLARRWIECLGIIEGRQETKVAA